MTSLIGAIVLLLGVAVVIDGAQITLRNRCQFTVWPGTLTGGGASAGWKLSPGKSASVKRPNGWTGRFWGRTGCKFDGNGNGRCATGDCGGLNCRGGGVPPVTLAEFTLAGHAGLDFYDVSLVDGFNIPVSVKPTRGRSGSCRQSRCRANVNSVCPSALQVVSKGRVVGCRSACEAWHKPEHCCTGAHNKPQTCGPSQYSRIFKKACPDAYSYAYDDNTSTYTCTGADYVITFCP